jgi:signal transduction histidine kinase
VAGVTDAQATSNPREWTPDRVSRFGLTWRIALAAFVGFGVWLAVAAIAASEVPQPKPTARFVLLDPLLGVARIILVAKYRRRYPLALAVLVSVISLISISASGASIWAAVSVATRRRPRELAIIAAVLIAVSLLGPHFAPMPGVLEPGPWWFEVVFAILGTAVTLAIGYAVGSRRALVSAWVDRARTAEGEQRARVAAAQSAERTRIAREMHDVLAHRISLVALHSGALRYRPDLPQAERDHAMEVIATNAEQALADLRDVLGVLRDPDAATRGAEIEPPQPDLPDVVRLIAEACSAGERIELVDELDDAVPTQVGRTAYRIIQEALTNARKHAPGSKVVVRLTGSPGDGLTIAVGNARSVTPPAALPTSGLGLLGLAERVDLLGGRLEHGPTPEGGHRLVVWLPWTT